jgi:hypothetical protein
MMSARFGGRLAMIVVAVAMLASRAAVAPVFAQAPPTIDVQTAFDTQAVTVGQRTRLVVTVRHAQELIITVEKPAQTAQDLDLVSADPGITQFDAAGPDATTTYSFVIAAFALGSVQPGPIRVAWLRADGTTGAITVQPPALNVVPTRAANDEQLRPMKSQVGVPGAPPAWERLAIPGGVLVALAGVAGLTLIWLRRRRSRTVEYVPPDVSAERRAREQLDGLVVPSRNASERYQHFYGAISYAVREYLQARFGFNATALTTRELEQRMVDRGVGRWQARLVSGLLDRCDAAVYAHDYPDPASADHDLTLAYEVVELSRPKGLAADAETAVPA